MSLICEIGSSHAGSQERLSNIVHSAVDAGANNIKFQIFTADSLVSSVYSPDRNKHFQRLSIPLEFYDKLISDLRVTYPSLTIGASLWSSDLIDRSAYLFDYLKVGSGDLTCLSIFEAIIRSGKPYLFSVGLSHAYEIENLMSFLSSRSSHPKAILYCKSSYPTPDSYLNLSHILTLKRSYPNVSIGYSHHHVSSTPILLSLSLGAEIIEVHFTDNVNDNSFRDNQLSFDSQSLSRLIDDMKITKTLLGSNKLPIAPTYAECSNNNRFEFRRSLYSIRDISAGTTLHPDDFQILRPFAGICASEHLTVGSLMLARDLKAGQVLTWNDVSLID